MTVCPTVNLRFVIASLFVVWTSDSEFFCEEKKDGATSCLTDKSRSLWFIQNLGWRNAGPTERSTHHADRVVKIQSPIIIYDRLGNKWYAFPPSFRLRLIWLYTEYIAQTVYCTLQFLTPSLFFELVTYTTILFTNPYNSSDNYKLINDEIHS
jgi:hypothetical protein